MARITWSNLNALGKSRVLRSSYIWLLIVPVAAKVIAALPDQIHVFGTWIRLDFGLPFSWGVFFLAALAFSIANLIYIIQCPAVVRDHTDAAHFVERGKSFPQLTEYARGLVGPSGKELDVRIQERELKLRPEARDEKLREWFWDVHTAGNDHNRMWMRACWALYLVGLVLLVTIFIQNASYVFMVMFSR